MAKIPRINENNEVIGETTIREAKENGWPRRAVRVFIFDSEKKFLLLQKRSEYVYTEPGKWDISGGHVDVGETYVDAGKREIQEELGVTVEPIAISEPVYLDNTFYVACVAFVDRTIHLQLKLDEVERVSWIAVSEIQQLTQKDKDSYTTWLVDAWDRFHDKLMGTSK